MTEEDWKKAEEQCSLFTTCILEIDGFRVSISEERYKNKILILVYVDGYIKGKWLGTLNEEIQEQKFYNHKSRYLHRRKWQEFMRKNKSMFNGKNPKERVVYVESSFPSFLSLKRQYKKRFGNNIKLLES